VDIELLSVGSTSLEGDTRWLSIDKLVTSNNTNILTRSEAVDSGVSKSSLT
jgi:hypothetical protein